MITTFTYYNGKNYITAAENNSVVVYEEANVLISHKFAQKITGAVYAMDKLIVSLEDNDGCLYMINENSSIEYHLDNCFSNVKVLKFLSLGEENYMVLQVKERGEDIINYVIYDMNKKNIYARIPMGKDLIDINFCRKDTFLQLVDYRVPSCYMDDDDELVYKIIVWNKKKVAGKEADYEKYKNELEASTGIWSEEDWWTCNYNFREAKCGMHYALFDYFLYSWPKELCISNRGNLILTYNLDFEGIIVSDIHGTAKLYFELPEKYNGKSDYYFDEEHSWLYILNDHDLSVYSITQNQELLAEVNEQYHMAEMNSKSVQNDFKFNNLFYKCLYSAKCTLVTKTGIEF